MLLITESALLHGHWCSQRGSRPQQMRKISNSPSPDFFQALNAPKSVFGGGSAPDPAGGGYDAPPDPLVGWGGGYLIPLGAFGV